MTYREMIAVVDPAQHTPELDCFNLIASMSGLPCSYHLPGLFGMKSIQAIPRELVRGIVVLGSNASVHDRLPWQDPLNKWLMDMMIAGIPTFGSCYGHQVIAYLFGGKIDFLFASKDKLKGFRNVEISADARLGKVKSTSPLIVSHREVVTQIPKDMELWATSDISANDGFRHKSLPIWTLQPHPEATPLFLTDRDIPQPTNLDDFSTGHEIIRSFLNFAARKTALASS